MKQEFAFEIGIIGAGIMGEALLSTFSKAGFDASSMSLADICSERLMELQNKYGCSTSSSTDIAINARNVFLVVKPQDLDFLLKEIGKSFSISQRIISFVAGKKTSFIEMLVTERVPVLRVMPNTPISVGMGASAISPGKHASTEDIKTVDELLKASGKTIVVDESLQDAVTATSGSGPAYFFRFVEAMIAGAQELGLSESDAKILVIQTIAGASEMLKQDGASPTKLRENVTSPNGTTFAALQVLESNDLETIIKKAMRAARDRSQELS
jgi:pyrroline-5-carboxylate reductase